MIKIKSLLYSQPNLFDTKTNFIIPPGSCQTILVLLKFPNYTFLSSFNLVLHLLGKSLRVCMRGAVRKTNWLPNEKFKFFQQNLSPSPPIKLKFWKISVGYLVSNFESRRISLTITPILTINKVTWYYIRVSYSLSR